MSAIYGRNPHTVIFDEIGPGEIRVISMGEARFLFPSRTGMSVNEFDRRFKVIPTITPVLDETKPVRKVYGPPVIGRGGKPKRW